jgi:hypothetical protein
VYSRPGAIVEKHKPPEKKKFYTGGKEEPRGPILMGQKANRGIQDREMR